MSTQDKADDTIQEVPKENESTEVPSEMSKTEASERDNTVLSEPPSSLSETEQTDLVECLDAMHMASKSDEPALETMSQTLTTSQSIESHLETDYNHLTPIELLKPFTGNLSCEVSPDPIATDSSDSKSPVTKMEDFPGIMPSLVEEGAAPLSIVNTISPSSKDKITTKRSLTSDIAEHESSTKRPTTKDSSTSPITSPIQSPKKLLSPMKTESQSTSVASSSPLLVQLLAHPNSSRINSREGSFPNIRRIDGSSVPVVESDTEDTEPVESRPSEE